MQNTMRRNLLIAGTIWIALVLIGEFLLLPNLAWFLTPPVAEEAVLIDDAFHALIAWAWPVLVLVLVALVYSFVTFRAKNEEADGALVTLKTSNRVYTGWIVITALLAGIILIDPGIKGVYELWENRGAELVVEVDAAQWNWTYSYPQYGVTLENADELVLPVDTQIKFEIHSEDVLHSFWIPAFRMKQDAVPGRTTTYYVTAVETGTSENNYNLRVQCAELCGTGHARMFTGVAVLEQDDFEAWVTSQQGGR